jgi:hypothetical protein
LCLGIRFAVENWKLTIYVLARKVDIYNKGSCVMIKTSNLRADIFHLLDNVIETGRPLEIERKGEILQIALRSGQAG